MTDGIDLDDYSAQDQERFDREQAAHDQRVADMSGGLTFLEPVMDWLVPDPEPPSQKQRLRLHVPDVKTNVTLGAKAPPNRIRTEDAGAPNYDGFGVSTKGHIFMEADGPDSSGTIQTKKDLMLQAEGGLSIGGQMGLIAASTKSVVVSGGGGVSIIGGGPNGWTPNRASDGTTPGTSPWIQNVSESSNTIAAVGAAVDAFTGLYHAVRGAKEAYHDVRTMPWKKAVYAGVAYAGGVFGGAASAVGALSGGIGTAETLGYLDGNPMSDVASYMGGTFIHGTGGMILTSTVTTGIYSLMGTTIGSPLGILIKGGFCDLHGVADVSVKALKGNITMLADQEFSVSSKGAIGISSLTSSVSIGGGSVAIGAKAGAGGQAATKSVEIGAESVNFSTLKQLRVRSDQYATVYGAKVAGVSSGDHTYLSGKSSVGISSKTGVVSIAAPKKHVGIRAGDFIAKVATDKAVFGKSGKVPDPPEEPSYDAPPPQPKSKKKRIQKKWSKKKSDIEKANADKKKAFDDKYKAWAKKAENMADASVGIVIKSSVVEIVCSGHKLTLDSSKLKTPSLIVQK